MKSAALLWTPYPWLAGFCITDDTDRADYDRVTIVYDHLMAKGIPTTKTVWPFPPEEDSGIPGSAGTMVDGVTFDDPRYFNYCKTLHANGFEICLHGASSGNNTRERTARALELIRREFGGTETFICHSKNADNLYWEEKVTDNPLFRRLLKAYSKHRCYGEAPASNYFWGDLCRKNVSQIRLFRTRHTNTLRRNPSMPFYDSAKPYVRSWFGATKRTLHDCTTPAALDALARENGLTVLYQYLIFYADRKNETVTEEFQESVERLSTDSRIWKVTAKTAMNRLRGMHGLFAVTRKTQTWLINTNDHSIDNVQIRLPQGVRCLNDAVQTFGDILVVPALPAQSITSLVFSKPLRLAGKRAAMLKRNGTARIDFGHGVFHFRIEKTGSSAAENTPVLPSYELRFREGLDNLKPMSKESRREHIRMLCDQSWILLREILTQGRSVNPITFIQKQGVHRLPHVNW